MNGKREREIRWMKIIYYEPAQIKLFDIALFFFSIH